MTGEAELPVPPRKLWLGYGATEHEYLESGRENVRSMLRILEAAGGLPPEGTRILDFGCGAGRMTRWLRDVAATREVWGADISAPHVVWCRQHLRPPFHFVVTTTLPHLPFEDRSFRLVFAGSVFTHVDDLAKAWFLEIRRVLEPGGRLYVTLHDRNTIALLEGEMRDLPLARRLRSREDYAAFSRSDFETFAIGRSFESQVFWDLDSLCDDLRGVFRVVSRTEAAYGYQTALLLEKE